jgi:hypothetical protein
MVDMLIWKSVKDGTRHRNGYGRLSCLRHDRPAHGGLVRHANSSPDWVTAAAAARCDQCGAEA